MCSSRRKSSARTPADYDFVRLLRLRFFFPGAKKVVSDVLSLNNFIMDKAIKPNQSEASSTAPEKANRWAGYLLLLHTNIVSLLRTTWCYTSTSKLPVTDRRGRVLGSQGSSRNDSEASTTESSANGSGSGSASSQGTCNIIRASLRGTMKRRFRVSKQRPASSELAIQLLLRWLCMV